jgi:single-stranded-DNA-specific exonuclease
MLNAAGRMGHARLAVELLRCENSLRAMQIAEYLKRQNYERQQTEKKIFKHVCEVINSSELGHPDQHTIVVCGQGWHPGVVGIVASRLVDRYYKPTIVLNAVNGTAQGSGRSIAGFDLLAGIKACSKHVSAFGGHKMAAGVTLSTKNVEGFKNDFEAYAKQNLTAEQVINTLDIDAAVKLKDLSMNTVNQLTEFAPFGQGNPRPVFATRGLRLAGAPRKVGAKGDHLQLTVTDNTATVRCIGFKMGKYEKKLLEKDFFSLAYEPDINHFNGQSTVQLVLSDINFD